MDNVCVDPEQLDFDATNAKMGFMILDQVDAGK
jgi:hypothetical protein